MKQKGKKSPRLIAKEIKEINKNRKPTIGFTQEDFDEAGKRIKKKLTKKPEFPDTYEALKKILDEQVIECNGKCKFERLSTTRDYCEECGKLIYVGGY